MENDRVKDSFNELADQHVAEITPSMMEFLQNLWQDGQYDNLLASNPKKIEPLVTFVYALLLTLSLINTRKFKCNHNESF